MLVYVDDLLLIAEDGVIDAATKAIAEVWAISDVEKAREKSAIKYCGFEIEVAEKGNGYVISQRNYEQEMIQRFNIDQSLQYPSYKIAEGDEDPEGPITPSDIKMAQSMAGALLWLTTRTRPDIAVAVASACRLATKCPIKSIEISTVVMQYVRGHPGGLHYPRGVPEETWGMRNQLKVERHGKLLEIFSDISFGAGSRHRSLQGLAAFYAGAIVAWQSSQQPFVTYSTAESELVAYCEALNAGRSMEAMICAMIKEPLGQNTIERVIYGDNAAAIAMAQGTGTSSWRTRHLRVRSSFLTEAIDGTAPGGLWKLLHLRGTELVADGLTKPLAGQSFFRFLQDLGMRGSDNSTELPAAEAEAHAGGGSQAAIRALIAGSLLVSQAKGSDLDEVENEATDWVFTAGTILMILGAIYSGQILFETSKCCLKRLRRLAEDENQDDGVARSRKTSSRSGSATNDDTTSMSSSSGSVSSAGAMRLRSSTQSGSATRAGAMSQASSSRSGLSIDGSSSGGGMRSTSKGMTRQSGCSSASGDPAISSGSTTRSGISSAHVAGNPATLVDNVVPVESERDALSSSSIGKVNCNKGPKGSLNPWNDFQHEHRGKGLSSTALSKMYKGRKETL